MFKYLTFLRPYFLHHHIEVTEYNFSQNFANSMNKGYTLGIIFFQNEPFFPTHLHFWHLQILLIPPTNKCNGMKVKSLCTAKDTFIRTKWKSKEWEHIYHLYNW